MYDQNLQRHTIHGSSPSETNSPPKMRDETIDDTFKYVLQAIF